MKSLLPLAAVAVALSTGTTAARAQSCRGVPSQPGQLAVQAGVSFLSHAQSYGVGLNANLRGSVALGAGFDVTNLDDVDPMLRSFGGDVALKFERGPWSLCPAIEVAYGRVSGLSTGLWPGPYTRITTLSMALTVAAGRTGKMTPVLNETVFASAGLVRVQTAAEAWVDGNSYNREEDTEYAFGAVLGVLLGTRRVHFGGSVAVSTLRDTDPVVTVGLGLVF